MAPPSDDVRASGGDEPPEEDTTTGTLGRPTAEDPTIRPALLRPTPGGNAPNAALKSTQLSPGQAPTAAKNFKSTQLSPGQAPKRAMTVTGLGPPGPPLPNIPAVSLPSDDETEGSTITTPRFKAGLPLGIPGSVEIRDAEAIDRDELLDETEVRTLPGQTIGDAATPRRGVTPAPPAGEPPRPAAGRSAADDSRVMRASAPEDAPSTLLDPPTSPRRAPSFNDDPESITARGPTADLPIEQREESVTAKGPAIVFPPLTTPAVGAPAVSERVEEFDDSTDGLTTRVKRQPQLPHPAEEDPESVTTQASGQLMNMLRVIAADDVDAPRAIEDDEPLQNQTAVMANAPVRLDKLGLSASSPIAPPAPPPRRDKNSSESGLRILPDTKASGERVSLGALGVSEGSAPVGTTGPVLAVYPLGPPHEVAKKPPYGVLVFAVMAMSVAIPLLVYYSLNEPTETPPARAAAQLAPDVNPRAGETARPKIRGWTPTVASGSGRTPAKPPRR